MADEQIAQRSDGKSGNNRPQDSNTHVESESGIRATVGFVRGDDGKSYNLIAERPNVEAGHSGHYGLQIRDANEPTRIIYDGLAAGYTGAPQMTPKMQKALDEALSKKGDGGTALTSDEAERLVNLALPKKEKSRER